MIWPHIDRFVRWLLNVPPRMHRHTIEVEELDIDELYQDLGNPVG